ncbi:MAG: hypothetical protein WCX81_07140 [Monoglobales bacterium]
MKMFGEHFYKKAQLKCTKDDGNIYTLAAADESGKRVLSVCYYSAEAYAVKKQVKINLSEKAGSFDCFSFGRNARRGKNPCFLRKRD